MEVVYVNNFKVEFFSIKVVLFVKINKFDECFIKYKM